MVRANAAARVRNEHAITTPAAEPMIPWEDRADFQYFSDKQMFGNERAIDMWHGLGTRIEAGQAKTADDVLRRANLDFEVERVPVYFEDGMEVPNVSVIVRPAAKAEPEYGEGPVKLGVVTERFGIVQNRHAFATLDKLVQAGAGTYEAAGALKRGAKVWCAVKMHEMEVRPGDTVVRYLLAMTGHDGRTSFGIYLSDRRPWCANQLQMIFASAQFSTVAKHSKNVDLQIARMEDALAAEHQTFKAAIEDYRAMARKKVSAQLTEKLFDELFPVEVVKGKEKELSSRRQNQISEMTELMHHGHGNNGSTLWDWFNGVTEYLDHGSEKLKVENAHSSWFGAKAKTRERAFRIAKEVLA